MKRAFRSLFALLIAAAGIYAGLMAVEQGATNFGVYCWIVALVVEYFLLISAPDDATSTSIPATVKLMLLLVAP